MRIRMETDAVLLMLDCIRLNIVEMVISPAHRLEVSATPDSIQRAHVRFLLSELGTEGEYNLPEVRQYAQQLVIWGLGLADAAHVAFAHYARCDFVSVDDRLLRQCRRIQMEIWCGTPMAYCEKENLG